MDILPQILMNGLIAGSLYALLALGFNLLFSTAKFFDMGYGVLAAVGGYTVFFFTSRLGLPLYVSIPLALLFGAGLSALIYGFVYLPLKKRKASSSVLLIASLGVFTVVQAIIAMLFTSQFQTLSGGETESIFHLGTAVVTGTQLVIFFLSLGVCAMLLAIRHFTFVGKAIRAVGDDEEVAMLMGIRVPRILLGVSAVSGAIAALAGVMVGFDTGIEPTMGMPLLLKAVIAAIVGGVGNIWGGFLGAFFLGLIENIGIWKISGEWKDAIAFAVLILFLLFRPQGILGKKK